MASSSLQRDARATPPPDQLASLHKLVDKLAIAAALCRHARDAELSASAAAQAEAHFGDDSLVVAGLPANECRALANLAVEASGAEQEVFCRQSWNVLLSLTPLLLRRIEANTLLPGTMREEELDYTVYWHGAAMKAQNQPVLSPSGLRAVASAVGYDTLLLAVYRSLDLLPLPLWTTAQTRMVESFVLQGLDVIPFTAGIPANWVPTEEDLVACIERRLNPQNHDPAFCAAVLHKWRSNAVSSVLQSRGVLQTGITNFEQSQAEFAARKLADIATHGLRDCALPSCSKTEKTVKAFAGCSGCRSVVYSLEHQALDWRAHKTACREKEAARLAEWESVEEAAGGAAAD